MPAQNAGLAYLSARESIRTIRWTFLIDKTKPLIFTHQKTFRQKEVKKLFKTFNAKNGSAFEIQAELGFPENHFQIPACSSRILD